MSPASDTCPGPPGISPGNPGSRSNRACPGESMNWPRSGQRQCHIPGQCAWLSIAFRHNPLTSTHFLAAALTYLAGTPTLLNMNDTATETVPESSDAPLLFTDAAARKVSELIAGEGNPKLMLRVFVQGGGCSGLQYGFEFDEQVQDGDTCVENQGVKLLIDPMSFQYLGGAEIDFRDNLDGAQFVIRNPQATTTCGCGSSFTAA